MSRSTTFEQLMECAFQYGRMAGAIENALTDLKYGRTEFAIAYLTEILQEYKDKRDDKLNQSNS